jgi:hypothetical protein
MITVTELQEMRYLQNFIVYSLSSVVNSFSAGQEISSITWKAMVHYTIHKRNNNISNTNSNKPN